MRLSIQEKLISKMPAPAKYNAWGWKNVDMTVEEIFEQVTVYGYAHSCELQAEHRHSSGFKSRQFFCSDVDGAKAGAWLNDITSHWFYERYSCGLYATPSFDADNDHRFRIMFVTEQPIFSEEDTKAIFRGLLEVFPYADKNCKDAVRLFYGTKDCEVKECFPEKFIPKDVVHDLIELGNLHVTPPAQQTPVVYKPIADAEKERVIQQLCSIPVIPYEDWLRIGWGLRNGGFALCDFQRVTTSTRGENGPRTAADAATRWLQGGRAVTMGSVYHFIKKHLPQQQKTSLRVY